MLGRGNYWRFKLNKCDSTLARGTAQYVMRHEGSPVKTGSLLLSLWRDNHLELNNVVYRKESVSSLKTDLAEAFSQKDLTEEERLKHLEEKKRLLQLLLEQDKRFVRLRNPQHFKWSVKGDILILVPRDTGPGRPKEIKFRRVSR